MDNLLNRPLGLAALITATVTLLAQPAVEQNAHQAALQTQEQSALAQFFQEQNLREIPRATPPNPVSPQTAPAQALSEEELQTARLVLSIESLFKSTTAN